MGKDIKRLKKSHRRNKEEIYNFLPDELGWVWSNEERLANIETLERGNGCSRRHSNH